MPGLNLNPRIFLISVLELALSASSWSQQSQTPAQVPTQSLPAAPQSAANRAQAQQYTSTDYSKPVRPFPNILAPYKGREIPEANMANTPRIDQLMRDGKLYLSMDDAVALALENNLDLELARYNLNIADTDVLRARAGSNILGVNTGIIQNTPGGGVGGLSGTVGSGTGGTSVAAGGAGTGTNGLVSSTLGIGPAIPSFDPTLTGNFQMDRDYALSSSALSGRAVTNTNTGTADIAYQQAFHTGTNLSVGWNNTHTTTDNPISALSPIIGSNFQFRVTQSLLQGFGFLPNTRFIRIAKNNREISDVAFRLQVITTVDQIENLYWNLAYAFENVRVQQEALAFAQKTLADNQKAVQVGTLPPINVVSAQSTVASNRQALTVAQTNLELQELLVKNALSRNLQDPQLAGAEVVPTSTIQLPAQEPITPTQDLINEALQHRAELAESRIDLTNRDISNRAVRNAMLPSLGLYAYYGGSGLGGALNQNAVFCSAVSTSGICINRNRIPAQFQSGPVGYGDTLSQMTGSTAPDKGIGFNLSVPILNRTAQANQVRAQLELRQAQVRLQQLENQVRIEVRNAQFDVQQNRASVDAAQAAVNLGRQTLDAEQKKLQAGVSNPTNVLQMQASLTTTESTLVSAMAAYEKSRVELDRATGLLLENTGIVVEDAERAQVTHMPTVPFVAPSTEVQVPPAPQ
ncbi:MAG TPA: TolC family protein [Terriglobales bacterium]|nr:TolC family protein [Terriglobales bacterium]